MTTKLTDKNRRTRMARVVVQAPKISKRSEALDGQYEKIRRDIIKLREDLAVGYDLVKQSLQTIISRRTRVKPK